MINVNNNCTLIGRLTADPELKYTASGIAHSRFTIAVDGMKNQESGEKRTTFIDCHVWRKQAENLATYMKKGRLIAVQGELDISSYTDGQGVRRKGIEINVNDIKYMDRPKDAAGDVSGQNERAPEEEPADEPVPF